MKLNNDGHIYFPTEDGYWVSENQRRIAEILKDYDHRLELQWIPPNERNTQDDPFRVIYRPDNAPPYLVFATQECDERLLARVFQADQSTKDQNLLSYLDAHNAAVEALRLKKRIEGQQEWHDLASSIIRNNRSSYVHGGIDFERPRRRY